jgi:hypothetical protein
MPFVPRVNSSRNPAGCGCSSGFQNRQCRRPPTASRPALRWKSWRSVLRIPRRIGHWRVRRNLHARRKLHRLGMRRKQKTGMVISVEERGAIEGREVGPPLKNADRKTATSVPAAGSFEGEFLHHRLVSAAAGPHHVRHRTRRYRSRAVNHTRRGTARQGQC